MSTTPLTVSQVTERIKKTIVADAVLRDVFVEGEVSNVRIPASGHMYFTLKDHAASLKCVCFRFQRQRVAFQPEHGMTVLAHGKIDLYPADGAYQLYVDRLDPSGVGALALAIRQRMELLSREGLFDQSIKRRLPRLPRTVAVVTSATGAAVQDVCTVIQRRAPMVRIIIVPTVVQGDGAVASVTRGLLRAQHLSEVDVILLVRGGGSFEDLLAFQDEGVARTIRMGSIPVVTGIGHEIDTTIADFAADQRAPTPSAAAELTVPMRSELVQELSSISTLLRKATASEIAVKQQMLDQRRLRLAQLTPLNYVAKLHQDIDGRAYHLRTLLGRNLRDWGREMESAERRLVACSPGPAIRLHRAGIAQASSALHAALTKRMQVVTLQLHHRDQQLTALSPLRTLERGYTITRSASTQEIFVSAEQVPLDAIIETVFKDGVVRSTVEASVPGTTSEAP